MKWHWHSMRSLMLLALVPCAMVQGLGEAACFSLSWLAYLRALAGARGAADKGACVFWRCLPAPRSVALRGCPAGCAQRLHACTLYRPYLRSYTQSRSHCKQLILISDCHPPVAASLVGRAKPRLCHGSVPAMSRSSSSLSAPASRGTVPATVVFKQRHRPPGARSLRPRVVWQGGPRRASSPAGAGTCACAPEGHRSSLALSCNTLLA